MVIRAFPIRVAGNSGPLPREIDWQTITRESGYLDQLIEYTTVTGNVRRVARFDPVIVRTSIEANVPTRIVLNHVDYVDASCRETGRLTVKAARFVEQIERELDTSIDYLGFGPASMAPHQAVRTTVKSA